MEKSEVANSDIHGGAVATPENISKLFGEFARGRVYYDGYRLGQMGDGDVEIGKDQDIQEVRYGDSPAGTKFSKRVRTGITLTCKFILGGNSLTAQSLAIIESIISDKNDGENDHMALSASNYVELPKGPVKIVAINSDGSTAVKPSDILNLYEVELNMEQLLKFNASDAQTWEIEAVIYPYRLSLQESTQYPKAGAVFGYIGDNEIAGVPKLNWPDRIEPIITKAKTDSAKALSLTLSKPSTLVDAANAKDKFIVKVSSKTEPLPVSTVTGISATVSSSSVQLGITADIKKGDVVTVETKRDIFVAGNGIKNRSFVYTVENTL